MKPRLLLALVALLAIFLPGCMGLDFSPDGRQIVTATSKGLAIMNVDGSGLAVLPQADNGSAPNWSPDGKRILYVKQAEQEGDLMLYDIAARKSRKIGQDCYGLTGWREDGGRCVSVHKTKGGGLEAVVYDVIQNGVTLRVKLPFTEGGADLFRILWLPNTDDFALLGGSKNDMDVYFVESGEVKKITTTADVAGIGLSGDRKQLLFARRSANMKYILLTVYAYDLKSRSVTRLPFPDRVPLLNPNPQTAPEKLDFVTFAPDGRHLGVVVEGPKGPKESHGAPAWIGIYTMKMDGSEAKALYKTVPDKSGSTNGVAFPVWSRDGSRIGLYEIEDKVTKVALFNADGSNGKRVYEEANK